MNGRISKLLRQVAKTIGRDPKYIKKHYKQMTPVQQEAYRMYVKGSLINLNQRKEVLSGENLPTL